MYALSSILPFFHPLKKPFCRNGLTILIDCYIVITNEGSCYETDCNSYQSKNLEGVKL